MEAGSRKVKKWSLTNSSNSNRSIPRLTPPPLLRRFLGLVLVSKVKSIKSMERSHQCPHCSKIFSKSRFLSSHISQSPDCHSWILAQTVTPDLETSSDVDLEEAQADTSDQPDFSSSEDSDIQDDRDILVSDEAIQEEALRSTIPMEPDIVDQTTCHTSAKKSKAQVDAQQPAILTDVYEGAGEVVETNETIQNAWIASQDTNNPYRPFKNKLDWEVGKWAKQSGLTSTAFDKLLNFPTVVEALGLSFKNARQLNQIIDYELPKVPSWRILNLKMNDRDKEYEIYYRDPLECIEALYSNPAFADQLVFAPEKQWADEEQKSRLYNEMNTGKWWWEKQASIKTPGGTVIPVIIGSDKSQLTLFSGNKEAYPVYITIGNIPKGIRRKPSKHAQMLLAYLPVEHFKGENLSKPQQRLAKARIFHAALGDILEPLVEAGRDGVKLMSGNGEVRHCHPIVASYVADYPEQCLVTCVRFGECPVCPCTRASLGKYADTPVLRKQRRTASILRQAKEDSSIISATELDRRLQKSGLVAAFNPFWENLPHLDIHLSITPDILHQMHEGMVKHLLEWITRLIGPTELDQRLQRMPPNHSLRVYDKGISGFSRLTGTEHRQLSKQLLGCLIDYAAPGVIRATRGLLDFLYIAQYQSHSEETLAYLEEALHEFHQDKDVFLKFGARMGNGFNLPKLHSLLHYERAIKAFGTTDGYNTESTERLHIDFVKNAYRASNKRDHIPQMVQWLERKEKIEKFGLMIEWHEDHILSDDSNPNEQANSHMTPSPIANTSISQQSIIHLAKNPTDPAVSVDKLIKDYRATLFPGALDRYLRLRRHRLIQNTSSMINIPPGAYDRLKRLSVPVWHRVKFVHANVQGLDFIEDTRDAAHCYPELPKKKKGTVAKARFDTVLVNEKGEAQVTGTA
ncbi:hypothetical protein FRC03_001582, partial [Tulasnella sp. 419]